MAVLRLEPTASGHHESVHLSLETRSVPGIPELDIQETKAKAWEAQVLE